MGKTPDLKPRKSPTQARAAETVRIILEAAARILEARGLEGFNTNAVAERAGVSVGSLYQYFPGKDALAAALIERDSETLRAEVTAAAALPDPKAALTGMIAAAVEHQMRRPVLAHLLDVQESRLPLGPAQEDRGAELRALLAQVLARTSLPAGLSLETAQDDIFALVRALTDQAGARGDTDAHALRERIGRALFGYLDLV
ncbi:TetR/AcrR family transcriptional regulator [Nitrospirillum sp. BR 11164]|uniref:TetR/AcrR family transcriptional regulator n=1 Tax=Nitrospirillum sp. BR 11164 TaxID=3104324 RepID=UPI002AFFA51C|nr:TetR/AcrR family transcriptional regulator [Nitrospirillum sp. BR 11164]MEA1651524.1 TetR/AcrR family transcriptional regulator [Nitrospirillum sp. BR 11164]